MKIAFYSTKPYDRIWFEPLAKENNIEIEFYETALDELTASLALNFDAICAFVNDDLSAATLEVLNKQGINLVLMRCAGYNNVDINKAKELGINVKRVPGYSPHAVAEFAMGLLLSVNRKIHKAYIRTKEFNMSINGLMGCDLYGKTAFITLL